MTEPEAGMQVLAVYVQPGASRAGVVGWHGGELKVRVTAPPEGGKANAEVVKVLAAELGLRHRDIEIVKGTTSRHKQVRVRRP